MSRECRECKTGTVEVVGMNDYQDGIVVRCEECGAEYELEADGLGEACMELIEAFEIEQRRRNLTKKQTLKASKIP